MQQAAAAARQFLSTHTDPPARAEREREMVFKRRSQSPVLMGSMVGEALPPLLEGPSPENYYRKSAAAGGGRRRGAAAGLKSWMKEQLEKTQHLLGHKRSRVRLLLGIVATSLGPFPVGKLPPTVCPKDSPIETSSAQYIVQQYIAATGGSKLHNSIHNAYAMGRMKMVVTEFEATSSSSHGHHGIGGGASSTSSSTTSPSGGGSSSGAVAESGCFVLWQMMPDKWYVEVAIAGVKVRAGCDAKLVWRQSPWSGSHATRGPIRPLRRALHGFDPRTVAAMFLNARCAGEKRISDEDCFVLKLAADSYALAAASTGGGGSAGGATGGTGGATGDLGLGLGLGLGAPEEEVIRHVAFGYFSQRSGLLVRMEDSQLTRVQSAGGDVAYWEITIETTLGDYRPVDGVPVPHSGTSVAGIFRFGEASMSHTRTRVEESWSIDDAAYNVPGLSADCFIPPADLSVAATLSDAGELFLHDELRNQHQNLVSNQNGIFAGAD